MKKKKMAKLSSAQKSTAGTSEVHALLDVMRAIKIKESKLKKKIPAKKRLIKKPKIDS